MTLIRVPGWQFGETVYISEVCGARKVKSDAPVASNKNRPGPEIYPFLGVVGASAPAHFFQTSVPPLLI